MRFDRYCLFIALNLYAGDLTVTGKLGVGREPDPNTKINLNYGEIGIGQQNDFTPYLRIGMDSSWDQYIANNAYWTGSGYNYVHTGGYGGLASRIHQVSGTIRFDTASGGVNPISWANRLYIANNGNVGIGTTNPQAALDIPNLNYNNGWIGSLSLGRSGGHYSELGYNVNFQSSNETYKYRFTDTAAAIRLGYNADGRGGGIEFRTAPSGAGDNSLALSTKMFVSNSGNVGIGTTTPGTNKLQIGTGSDVLGSNALSVVGGDVTIDGAGTARDPSMYFRYTSSTANIKSDKDLSFWTGASPAEKMRISTNGNVGIGTTSSPGFRLDVNGNSRVESNTYGGVTFEQQAYPNQGALLFSSDRTGYTFIISNKRYADNNILPIISMYDSGNVGIGTTSPAQKLTLRYDSSTTDGIGFQDTNVNGVRNWRIGAGVGGANLFGIYDDTASSVRVSINSFGYLGIGILSPSYRLQLSTDSAAKPYTNTWTVYSDQRLKTNIRPFKDGLSVITGINPVWYQYNGAGGIPDTEAGKDNIGVVAQEIQKVAPYTVGKYKTKLNKEDTEDSELLNYNSHALTFVLINAIKEQQKQIEELQKRIAILENKSQ